MEQVCIRIDAAVVTGIQTPAAIGDLAYSLQTRVAAGIITTATMGAIGLGIHTLAVAQTQPWLTFARSIVAPFTSVTDVVAPTAILGIPSVYETPETAVHHPGQAFTTRRLAGLQTRITIVAAEAAIVHIRCKMGADISAIGQVCRALTGTAVTKSVRRAFVSAEVAVERIRRQVRASTRTVVQLDRTFTSRGAAHRVRFAIVAAGQTVIGTCRQVGTNIAAVSQSARALADS